MKKEMPIIYRYHEYINYVEDMIDYISSNGKDENMKSISQKLDITPSYLSMILNRKRELSRALTKKFASLFSLSKTESDFFELLVDFNVTSDDKLKSEYFERMKRFKKYRNYNNSDTNWHDYMSNWLNITIREMTALENFCDDPKWIQSNLKNKASLSDIKASLDFLKCENIIVKNSDGTFSKPDYEVSCTDKIYSNALAQFHREFLQLAGDSIGKSSSEERQLIGHCVAFDEESFTKAKDILNEALDKIINLTSNSNNNEKVYFMELALFPLTKK